MDSTTLPNEQELSSSADTASAVTSEETTAPVGQSPEGEVAVETMHDASLNTATEASNGSQQIDGSVKAVDTPTKEEPFGHLKKALRDRQNLQAKVIKWQRNGLEMELEDGTRAFMPNDMIDRDPNRNIANYFGKTLPVRVTNVKVIGKVAEVSVSHRAVIEDDLRQQGKEKIQTLNIGDVIEGKVKSFNNHGAVVDVGAGIDAVIRTSDLTWETIEHPFEAVKRGDTIQAKILQIDKGRRRVQLGIRQLTPDPFLERFAKYNAGDVKTGKVVRLNDLGAELEFEQGITAFLPISEISWTRIETVGDVLKNGDEVEVKLINVDAGARKLTASKKQLIENPLRAIENTFKLGSDHKGVIKEVNRGGVVVTLELGAEGFVPRRELSHDRIERLEDTFKAGKELDGLRVIEYDRRNGKVTLSYIAAERDAQRTTLKNYKVNSSASSFTLGDLASLKEKLEKIEREG